jgi:hypothetical protein
VYVHGHAMMRRGAVQTWAQHRANAALALMAEKIRPAYTFMIYNSYGANPGGIVVSGNYLKVVSMNLVTSTFYKSGTTIYYVESETTDNKSSSSDDLPLLTDVPGGKAFIGIFNQVQVLFKVRDPRETNRVLVAVDTFLTPRNR